jgi:hypothetical protein
MHLHAIILTLAVFVTVTAHARGVSPYLPLSQAPEIERMIEGVLILADKPVLTRPIAAATVYDALPAACEQDVELCDQVRHYLRGYMKDVGIGHLSVSAGAGSGESTTLQNRHGMRSDSAFEASGHLYWQRGDYILLSAGFAAHEDEVVPTGSLLSLGVDYAQLDVGWRGHWLSPMTDSVMLLGTQAPTMPSVTLSNYKPLTALGIRYEIFYARMSESDDILFEGGITSGNPRLAGLHLSIEPVPGWSIGVNRLMQYGGGERGNDSFGDLFDALFRPSVYDNTGEVTDFGNQLASFTSSFLVRTPVPFAIYFEYAGEDTSTNNDLRLGNAALSAGIHFPRLGRALDLTIEASEWQNGWYVHHIYGDGLRNEGNVLGHWGGDWRVPEDGVGGSSFMLRAGWRLASGDSIEATYRTLANEDYTAPDYERAHSLDLRYSRRWRREFLVGGELNVGRDVFGEEYSRVSAFFRF